MSERILAGDFLAFCDVNGIGIVGKDCVKRVLDFIHYAGNAAAEAEREPITDKSICQRGHPVKAGNHPFPSARAFSSWAFRPISQSSAEPM